MTKRCNDCAKATNRGQKGLAIRCTLTNTFVSPFADVCSHYISRGRRPIGNGLIKILEAKKEG